MPAHVLAWAMTVAGVAQFLWMVIACRQRRHGAALARGRGSRPTCSKLLRLMVPGIIGSGVMQINLVIGTHHRVLAGRAPSPISTMPTASISSRWR